jgi:hypothetical protein
VTYHRVHFHRRQYKEDAEMRIDIYLHIEQGTGVTDLLNAINGKLDLSLKNEDTIMTDVTALQAVAARLQASDTAALAALQSLKDQNTALAAQLGAIQTGDPTTQAAIDAVVTQLTTTADAVDAAVTANPATPNLT